MKIINKKFVWLAFIGTSLVSIIYLGMNLRTENEKPKTTIPVISITPPMIQPQKEIKVNTVEIDPSLKWPEIKSLAVYEASVSSLDLLAAAQKISEGLNLSRKSISPPVWGDSNFTRYLTIDYENGTIKYQVDGYSKPELYSGKNPPTLSSSMVAAQTFIRNFPAWSGYRLDETSVHFTSGETNLVSVSFYPTFKDFLLTYDNQTSAPLVVEVGQKNTVVIATFIPKQIVISNSPIETVLASQEEVLQNITSGQISPIDLIDYKPTTENKKQIGRIVINKVVLEYRVVSSQNKVFPFYRLSGQGAFYLVPAIKL